MASKLPALVVLAIVAFEQLNHLLYKFGTLLQTEYGTLFIFFFNKQDLLGSAGPSFQSLKRISVVVICVGEVRAGRPSETNICRLECPKDKRFRHEHGILKKYFHSKRLKPGNKCTVAFSVCLWMLPIRSVEKTYYSTWRLTISNFLIAGT